MNILRSLTNCPLCTGDGGLVLWQNTLFRIVQPDEGDFPGLLRVIVNAHVAEMSDLAPAQQTQVLQTVMWLEAVVRRVMRADKMNIASLGNVVPHVHWHIIPRWRDDTRFPDPIWSMPKRAPDSAWFGLRQDRAKQLAPAVVQAMNLGMKMTSDLSTQ